MFSVSGGFCGPGRATFQAGVRGALEWIETSNRLLASVASRWTRRPLRSCSPSMTSPSIRCQNMCTKDLKSSSGHPMSGLSSDYIRHCAIITLFAELNLITGQLTRLHKERRRRADVLASRNTAAAALIRKPVSVSTSTRPSRPRASLDCQTVPGRAVATHTFKSLSSIGSNLGLQTSAVNPCSVLQAKRLIDLRHLQ
jgi:hypothetical protein